MRRLILIAAMSAMVLAKPNPEKYKETEDFQYSRSSSDDGSKSGFYGAQRGNLGGNYERAHNMDTLAQHQMSSVVRQVEGELGEGAKTRTGSVYTAANSRGIYGSGHYDLSNLEGRNFAEGESFGNSHLQSHSSISSQNSKYGSHSYSGMGGKAGISSSLSEDARYSGYQSSGHEDQRLIDNLQAVDTSQGFARHETNNQADYNTKYHTQFGALERNNYDQSSANIHSSRGYDTNSQAHYITTPVRVVVRPGGRVAIPITAPTYAVSQNTDGINSDAEVINQQAGIIPTNKAKHYESSYSYRKQWEKHHSIPGDVTTLVPTENPFPKNSELYEAAQLLQSSKNLLQNTNSEISGNMNRDQTAYAKTTSSQSRLQAGYNSQKSHSGFESQNNDAGFNSQQSQSGLSSLHGQSGLSSLHSQSSLNSQQSQLDYDEQQSHLGLNSQQKSASSTTHGSTYGHNALNSELVADLTNAARDVNTKPKSYHSSYSYHKSWERQGDPYVIKPIGPIGDGQASEKLTAALLNSAAYSSHQYGSHSRQAHQSHSADCDDQGHVRVARSYNNDHELDQGQSQWEDLGQQTVSQLENLEDLGQQTQNQWDNLQQLGQESQNQWDNLQQLGQETNNQWDNLQQLGQQTQDKWDNLQDFGQQTHRDLKQHQNEKLEDFNLLDQQQDVLTNFEQQANNQNENLHFLSHHTQNEDSQTNFEQQVNNQHKKLDVLSQHSQNEESLTNFEQQANTQHEKFDILNQYSQSDESLPNFKQQANTQPEKFDVLSQHSRNEESLTNFEQQANTQHEKFDVLNQYSQSDESLPNFKQQANTQHEKFDDLSQHTQNEESLNNFEQQANTQHEKFDVLNQYSQNDESLPNFEQQANTQHEKFDFLSQHSQNEESLTNSEQQANTQHKNIHNSNSKDQTIGFEPQSNEPPTADNVNQLFFNVNKQNNNDRSLFFQNQQNKRYQSNANQDKNILTYDFMKPISNWPDNTDRNSQPEVGVNYAHVNDMQNVFPVFSSDIEHKKFWHQNEEQEIVWNTENKYEHNFLHMNNFNNFNDQFEKSFSPASFSTSDTGNPLKGLWEKIDNIAGETKPTGAVTGDKKLFSYDNSHFNSQNEKVNQIQNGTGNSNNIHENTNIISTNVNTEYTEKNLEHNNLFDEYADTQNKSVTDLPKLFSQYPPTSAENDSVSNIIHDRKSIDTNKNKQLQNEGRGDIESEETPFEMMTADKPYKTPQQIEILSLTKEIQVPNEGDIIIQPQSITTEDKNSNSNFKNNGTLNQPSNQPTFDVLDLNNNPLSDLRNQIPHQQIAENVEMPEDIQQQNIEQQYQNFNQMQSSWISSNNLQQGYDQQNMEQQFEDLHYYDPKENQDNLQDFSQHVHSLLGHSRDVPPNNQNYTTEFAYSPNNYEQSFQPSGDKIANFPLVIEPTSTQVSHIINVDSKSQHLLDNEKGDNSKSENVQSPVETSSEKPGFWKSIGNKFTSTKDKVFSWFSRS